MDEFKEIIGTASYAIESVGVLIIIIGFIVASVRILRRRGRASGGQTYQEYRRDVGRSIILGLEFLIAGDIIRTVVVSDTLSNVAVLALIILIRTFLAFTLHLEVEGGWPWQKSRDNEMQ